MTRTHDRIEDTRIEMEQMDLLQLQYVLFRRKISDKKTALKI